MKGILKLVELKRANRTAGREINLFFQCLNKQSSKDMMKFDELLDSRGILYYLPDVENVEMSIIEEIDNMKVEYPKGKKTRSQRLRNAIYRRYEQTKTDLTFSEFYDHEMDIKITEEINKLHD